MASIEVLSSTTPSANATDLEFSGQLVKPKKGRVTVGKICVATGDLRISADKTSCASAALAERFATSASARTQANVAAQCAAENLDRVCAAVMDDAHTATTGVMPRAQETTPYRCFDHVRREISSRSLSTLNTTIHYLPQISEKVMSLVYSSKPVDRAYYFHTTTNTAIKSILETGQVKPHRGRFLGVAVSTRPETIFGRYVLGFNRTIETSCDILVGDSDERDKIPFYWAGCGNAIPVTAETLEFVAVFKKSESERRQLSEELSKIAGRSIPVVSGDAVMPEIEDRSKEDGVCIPAQWPTNLP